MSAATSNLDLRPADVLMNLIAAFLAPMFLVGSRGDIGYARLAAIETVNAYRIQNQADLLSVAQIIAFGLAALGSLSLSLSDGISLPMALRLRGNANACNRSAETNRRALEKNHQACPQTVAAESEMREAATLTEIAEMQRRAEQTRATVGAQGETLPSAHVQQPASVTLNELSHVAWSAAFPRGQTGQPPIHIWGDRRARFDGRNLKLSRPGLAAASSPVVSIALPTSATRRPPCVDSPPQ